MLGYTVEANASSKFELDRAKFQIQVAEARLTAHAAVAEKKAAERVAQAQFAQAQSDLNVFLAGPGAPTGARAKADLTQSQAPVAKLATEMARRSVRSPRDGIVISCYLNEGEYAMASRDTPDQASIVIGSDGPLHIRVDVDEFDAPQQASGPDLPAVALFKSQNRKSIPLERMFAPNRSSSPSARSRTVSPNWSIHASCSPFIA